MEKKGKNEAASSVRSLDELDKVLKITTPGTWMVLLACFALLAGVLAWGMFGTVSEGVSASGIVKDGKLICILDPDEVKLIGTGDTAVTDGKTMTVEKIAEIPVSREEALELLGSEYLVSENMNGDWAWPVTLVPADGSGFSDGTVLNFEIITEKIPPLSMIWKDI